MYHSPDINDCTKESDAIERDNMTDQLVDHDSQRRFKSKERIFSNPFLTNSVLESKKALSRTQAIKIMDANSSTCFNNKNAKVMLAANLNYQSSVKIKALED